MPIKGIRTSNTAFVGPTARGPSDGVPKIVCSYAEFEQVYGGDEDLRIGGRKSPNYMAHSARAYFAEGGQRLCVARVSVSAGGRSLTVEDYVGASGPNKSALSTLDERDDISIIATPGAGADMALGRDVMQALIENVDRHRYRFAVLDSFPGQSVDEVRTLRSQFDTSHASLYYPWVLVNGSPFEQNGHLMPLPPSGFVCGVYARVDRNRGIYKAPANEVIFTARGLERDLSHYQQELLSLDNVNCLRHISPRGHLVWGARTLSLDPEWRYISIRRYRSYLEHSIETDIQWVAFEENAESLWSKVRHAIESFLYQEFRAGALQGATPDQAYFVRCDRSTMTQNDINNGRMICEIGVSLTRPAEFIIFRIGQKTSVG